MLNEISLLFECGEKTCFAYPNTYCRFLSHHSVSGHNAFCSLFGKIIVKNGRFIRAEKCIELAKEVKQEIVNDNKPTGQHDNDKHDG